MIQSRLRFATHGILAHSTKWFTLAPPSSSFSRVGKHNSLTHDATIEIIEGEKYFDVGLEWCVNRTYYVTSKLPKRIRNDRKSEDTSGVTVCDCLIPCTLWCGDANSMCSYCMTTVFLWRTYFHDSSQGVLCHVVNIRNQELIDPWRGGSMKTAKSKHLGQIIVLVTLHNWPITLSTFAWLVCKVSSCCCSSIVHTSLQHELLCISINPCAADCLAA